MSIARYTLICSSKSAHREVRHSTNKRLIDCLGLHLESLFLFSTYKSVLEIKLQNAFLVYYPMQDTVHSPEHLLLCALFVLE